MSHKRQRFISPHVAEYPPGHWSNVLRVGDIIYVSGCTSRADDRVTIQGKGNAYEQARIVFTKIKHLVEAAGGKMSDVVKLNIYVTNMADNKEVWRARQEFFSGDFPASTLVQVAALGTPEILLEIEAIAHAGCGD